MNHEDYIRRCIQLAKNGLATASPNPLVGSVIVYDNTIIGEGWHYKKGMPHAEVNAIKAVKDKGLLKKATLYVNLEPCAHFGSTPPCANLIVEMGIPKVVIGTRDPFAKVNGKGVEILKNAGIEVIENILQDECLYLNKRFFTFHRKKRPYIILKWAQTQDGFIAPANNGHSKKIHWISQKETQVLVHQWRSEEDAILVGKNTVLNDNPSLTTREVSGKNPVRLVLDNHLQSPGDSAVFSNETKTIIFNTIKDEILGNTHFIKLNPNNLSDVLGYCYNNNLLSIIVEGGSQTLQSFIDANLWDEARVITGISNLKEGIKAPKINSFKDVFTSYIGKDSIKTYSL